MQQIPFMVQNLYSQNPASQLEATAQFRKVLSKEKNPPIKEVISVGVVPRFVEFLRSEDPQIQVKSLFFSIFFIRTLVTPINKVSTITV